MIPYSRQTISKNDIDAVVKVLKSDYLTQGPKTLQFEKKLSEKFNAKYVITANSASSALHLACLSLDIKSKDIVWTVPNTYAASANCALLLGAKIDFVDINNDTFNISVEALEKKLKLAKKINKLPKLIVIVHFGGMPSDLKKIKKLKNKYNFKLIEDASHAVGSKYFKKPIGKPIFSDAVIFSFHPVKVMTTIEGGCLLTNSKKIYNLSSYFRENGIIKNKKLQSWKYKQHFAGYNFRMNEVSAALGISQLKKLNTFLKKRNSIAKYYRKKMKNLPIKFQHEDKNLYSSYHLMIIRFDFKKINKSYEEIFNYLRKKKFFVNLHYYPLHLQPIFQKRGFKAGMYSNAESYAKEAMSIPIYPDLKKKKIDNFIKILKNFIS